MKKTILSLVILSFFACKTEVKKEEASSTSSHEEISKKQQTYAELSIREGDDWKPEKFGGGAFMNVDSLQLPEGHSDHAYYIRYEGPGWENAHVGYRLYLDWRNAIDIFGKKVDSIVLPYVGQDDYERYHHESPWGQDILKAGKSLGIGSYGQFINDTMVHFKNVDKTVCSVKNHQNSSDVIIDYDGWKTAEKTINLDAKLTIFPNGRYTKTTLTPSEEITGLCTGIVKFKDIPLQQKTAENGSWAYIATYGTQTLVNKEDKLGMAIFYKTSEVANTTEGPFDHLVIFKPTTQPINYYFSAAWEQEKNGITSEEAFYASLNEQLKKLATSGSLNE
ncbi:protein of unknown function [Pustulibacterium marinum]|uniref:DUF4861 domain-containing protein n=1 Tax=Pustulibacterium marinum TaxID=1224947 RepID=A0A1I7EUG4_9FLAO|nr:DUF4861 family protein [Pustulibacterium marinum]SFU27538.1 protein of unknown function [Pustulibacterium marinum]